MFHSPILVWLLLAIGFFALEAGTAALVSIWFAAGSAAALLAAVLGARMWVQTLVFVVVSAAALAGLRPLLRKHIHRTKTNVDSVIGSRGYVTADIDNVASTGQVKLGAMTWTARSTEETKIAAGTQVQVDRIEGVKVFVTPVHRNANVN